MKKLLSNGTISALNLASEITARINAKDIVVKESTVIVENNVRTQSLAHHICAM
jgi:hypothetical protein